MNNHQACRLHMVMHVLEVEQYGWRQADAEYHSMMVQQYRGWDLLLGDIWNTEEAMTAQLMCSPYTLNNNK